MFLRFLKGKFGGVYNNAPIETSFLQYDGAIFPRDPHGWLLDANVGRRQRNQDRWWWYDQFANFDALFFPSFLRVDAPKRNYLFAMFCVLWGLAAWSTPTLRMYRTLRKEEKRRKFFFFGCIWTLWASDIFTTGDGVKRDGREFFIASCKFKCIYTPTFLQHIE